MNRETKRLIQYCEVKPVIRALIRREAAAAKASKTFFAIDVSTWLRSQPNSTRKGYNRGNLQRPSYVQNI